MTSIPTPAALRRAELRQAARFFDIYQQLGMAWQFLGLRCRHWDGFRRARGGLETCRICGLVRGVQEPWLLLPRDGPKTVGRMVRPRSPKTFPNKKAASLLEDSISFHGARLSLDVHNKYRSDLFKGEHDIAISDERAVRLHESGVECVVYNDLICVREFRGRGKGRGRKLREPPYGGFAGELPKRLLRRFPVIFEYGADGRFLGLTILRPWSRSGSRPKKPSKAAPTGRSPR